MDCQDQTGRCRDAWMRGCWARPGSPSTAARIANAPAIHRRTRLTPEKRIGIPSLSLALPCSSGRSPGAPGIWRILETEQRGIAAVRQQLDQRDDQRRVDLLTALGWPLVATTRSCCTQATSNAQTTDKMIGPKNKPLIP